MADKILLPDGTYFPVKEGETQEEAMAAARQLYPDAFAKAKKREAEPQNIQLPDGSYFPLKAGETTEQAMQAARRLYPSAFATKKAPEQPGTPGLLTDVADFAKKFTGSTVSGVLGSPYGIEQGVKGAARSAMEGEPTAIMPMSVYQPGLDTEDTLFGAETPQERTTRKLQAQRAVASIPDLPGARALSGIGKDVKKSLDESVSEYNKRAIQQSTPSGNIFKGELSFGDDPSVRGYIMQAADVFGSLAPVIATAIATKSPTAAGTVGGAMAADEASTGAAEYIGKLTHAELLATSPLYAELISGGASPEEARDLITRKAAETGAILQGLVAAFGDRFTGKLLTGALDGTLRKIGGKSVLARTGAGVGLGMGEEGIQEVSEGVASDLAIQNVVRSKEIGEDSAANLILGAIGGSGPGGYRGLRSGLQDRNLSNAAAQRRRTLLDTLAEGQDATELDAATGGEGAGVVGGSGVSGGATGVEGTQSDGVVPAGSNAGASAGGTGSQPDAVSDIFDGISDEVLARVISNPSYLDETRQAAAQELQRRRATTVAPLDPDFRRQYNELRSELLGLLSISSPTQADLNRMKLVQKDLDGLVDSNAEAINAASGDARLTQSPSKKFALTLKNAMFDGNQLLADIESLQASGTPGDARAMRGDLFGSRPDVLDLPNRALAIAGQDPDRAVAYLQRLVQRTRERMPTISTDSNWGRRFAPMVGMTGREGFDNPARVAELYAAQQEKAVADAIAAISPQGQPRAMQGDLFGGKPTTDSEIDAAVDKLEALLGPKPTDTTQELGAEPEAETTAEPTAEQRQREAEQEQRRREAKEKVEAPATSTERVLETPGGQAIKRFFDLIQSANPSQSDVAKHRASKNSAASTLLEYDIAQPGQQNLPGLQRAVDYLVSKVGGQEKFDALMESLDGATPAEQAALLRRAGLPDLTSRRGMDSFRDQVQREVQKLTVPGEGVSLPSKSVPSKVTGTPIPYREELNTGESEAVSREPDSEGKPRRPSMQQRARQFIISDTKVRAAVRVLRDLVQGGFKLSDTAAAAVTYFSNPVRSTFGEALNDLAFDLAMFEIDPDNYGAGSTFPGEGGKYAKQFQEWVNTNLDKNTVETLNELVAMHKRTAAENAKYEAAVSAYNAQLDAYAEKQRQKAEQTSTARLPKAPKRISQRVEETEAGEQETEPSAPKVPAKNIPRRQALFEVHPAIRRALEAGDTRAALELISKAEGNPYYAALADRLLAAGITAKTTFIDTDTLQPLSATDNTQFDNYINALGDIVAEALPVEQQAALVSMLKSGRLRDVTAALAELRASLPTSKATEGQIEIFNEAVSYFNKQYGWVAKYDPATDTMVFRRGSGLTNATFLHEALHAATAILLDNPNSLAGVQRQGYDQLLELYKYSRGMLSQNGFAVEHIYGLQDLHEFVSEALTNPEFQAQLRTLRYKASPFSLSNWFTEAVRKLFNIKKGYESNVLNEVIFATDAMMLGTTAGKEKLVATSGPKAARGGSPSPLPSGRPNIPGASKAMLNALFKPKNWNQIRPLWPVFYANLKANVRPNVLGALTLEQIADLVNKRLPQLDNFIRVTNNFLSRKNAILNEAAGISRRWEQLQARDPAMSRKLGAVMHAATISEFDPDPLVPNTTAQRAQNAAVLNMWRGLSPEARAVYREVRDFYEKRYSEYRNTLNRRMAMMAQYGVSTTTINNIRAEFDKAKRKGPYFPLMRRGRFAYQIGRGMTREYYMFESLGEMELHMQQRLTADPHLRSTVQPFYDYKEAMDAHARESNFLRNAFDAIDSANFTGTAADEAARKQELKDNVYQTWLANQPESSFRNRFIHRTNMEGFSQDALRNFATSSFHMAYQLSRFEYSPDMFSQMQAAKQQLKARIDPANPADPVVIRENTELSDYVQEAERRLSLVLNPTDVGTIPSMLSNIGFVWYLTSIASAAVNILGGTIIGIPTLVGQQVRENPGMPYSTATLKALGQMQDLFRQAMGTGFDFETGARIRDFSLKAPSLQRAKDRTVSIGGRSFQITSGLTRVEQAAYDRLVADGVIDITGTYDMSGLASKPTEDYSGIPNKAMQVVSYPFHNAERFIREVVAMSAFRLAMEKRASMSNRQQAFAESIQEAKAATHASLFNYSSTNKPRWFQNSIARVVLQFKQFPQQMTWYLSRSLWKSMAGQSPEVRREARARFVGTMGMTAIFSGATGLWGFSTVAAIINACAAMFGDEDEEEPFDFELEFKNWTVETFGKNLGTAISSGTVNAAGVDVGSRVKLDEMWFRDSRKNQDEVEALRTFLVDLLGPTIGLGVKASEAVKLWNEGHADRAMEAVAPAFLKNPMVALRYSKEGVNTLAGDPLMEDMGPFLLMMQGLGFRSAELAERQYYNITKKGQEVAITKLRTNLLNGFAISIMAGDYEGADKAMDKIGEFNQKHPTMNIPVDSILRSVQERIEKSAMTDRGLYIDPRLLQLLNETYMDK